MAGRDRQRYRGKGLEWNRHVVRGLLLATYLRLLGPLLGAYEAFGGNRNPTWGAR